MHHIYRSAVGVITAAVLSCAVPVGTRGTLVPAPHDALAPEPTSESQAPIAPKPDVQAPEGRATGLLRWPLVGPITARFGVRGGRPHDGIDISAPKGTPVIAAADGEVLFSDLRGGYGNLVVLKHDDGLVTVYAHHDRNLVRVGETVRRGQEIAQVGATGRASGPHLHFEVRQGVRAEDPLRFLGPR